MDEYTPCKKPDPTAREAIGNVMRETRPRITGSRRRKALSKDMRAQVYEMYGGHCAYCGKEIDIKEMQVDHVQSVYLGGEDEITNYRPACRQCNFYKSTLSVEGLREQLGLIVGRLEKLLTFRLALAHGLIRLTGRPVKFYFEECEKRC
ncbi:MAG: HNH endonuclease [Selenomonas noxia]|nr:HNH endonuclease [Selenomonas noxia]